MRFISKLSLFYIFSFRIDNTDHIIDVNEGSTGSPFEYDQVNIICPLYDQRTTPNEMDTEKFVIYHVNKEEFDTCRIMSAHPRIIAQCDKPYSLRYFTISFRSFSPTPGALEFHAGTDYFFISTSSQSDLHRRVDGMCRSHNMKIVFKVADKQKNRKSVPENNSAAVPSKDDVSAVKKPEPSVKHPKNQAKLSGWPDSEPEPDFEADEVKPDQEVRSFVEKAPVTFTARTGDLENRVVVEDDEQDRDGGFFNRKEPKSLDYYLYQTRSNSNSISNGLDTSKRSSKSSFKQEASTGGGQASNPATSVSSFLRILSAYFFTVVLIRWR